MSRVCQQETAAARLRLPMQRQRVRTFLDEHHNFAIPIHLAGEMAPASAIGFYGGMALLVSSITGPGLTTIPLLFQQAGWFTFVYLSRPSSYQSTDILLYRPTLAFFLLGLIALIVSLFLVETMSSIHGNEAFQAKVEYSTVAHLYLGRNVHIVMQVLLFFALQSVNVASMIISEQTIDSLLIRVFDTTCALSFKEGWICGRFWDETSYI